MAIKSIKKRVNSTLTQSNIDDVGGNVATTAPTTSTIPQTPLNGTQTGGTYGDYFAQEGATNNSQSSVTESIGRPATPSIPQPTLPPTPTPTAPTPPPTAVPESGGSGNVTGSTSTNKPTFTESEVNKDSTGGTNNSGGRPVRPNIPPITDPPPPEIVPPPPKEDTEVGGDTPTTDEVIDGNGNVEVSGGRETGTQRPHKTQPPTEDVVVESGETTTPPSEDVVVEEEPPMTYGEWVEYQKQLEAEQLAEAERQAEIYRERAEADAQAAYLQNQATYGANAETMAQMGLTGGGYSDYLNSQAYAQKRSDMQTAQANEAALKQQAQTTYAEGIRALDKGWMEYNETQNANKKATYNQLLGYAMDAGSGLTEDVIRAMGKSAGMSDAEIQEIIDTHNTTVENAKNEKAEAENKQNATYSDNAYKGLLADVQNPNTYGNYTEAGIRSLGKQWGWSDEQIQEAVDIWKSTKENAEISLDGEDGGYNPEDFKIDEVVLDINNGIFDGNTWDEVYEILLIERNKGADITDEDIAKAKNAYETRQAYKDGKVSTDDYYNALNGDEGAQGRVESVKAVETAKATAAKYVSSNLVTDTIVNVNDSGFKSSDFGSYYDTGKAGTLQEEYTQTIIADAKAGKIKEGQLVIMNYGEMLFDKGVFVYVGDGKFVKLTQSAHPTGDYYTPNGYKITAGQMLKS